MYMQLEIESVAAIARSASGKYRFCGESDLVGVSAGLIYSDLPAAQGCAALFNHCKELNRGGNRVHSFLFSTLIHPSMDG